MAKKAAKKKTGGKAAKKTIKKKMVRAAAKPVRKGKPSKSTKPMTKTSKNAKPSKKATRPKTSSRTLRTKAKSPAKTGLSAPAAVAVETTEVIETEVEESGHDQDDEVDAPAPPMTGVTLEHAKKISPEKSSAFAVEVARMIRDDKCEDVVVLDVRGRSPVTDYLVIGSGTSDRQMRSVLQHVEDYGAKTGNDVVRRSIDERATWILADFVDVVVHLFEPNTRAHYDLEMLWGDSKRVAWERPDQVSRDYAGLNS